MFSGCALYLLPGRDMSQQRRKVLKGIVTSNGGTVCEEISTATSLGLNEAAKRSCEPQYCLVLRLNEWCERERESVELHTRVPHTEYDLLTIFSYWLFVHVLTCFCFCFNSGMSSLVPECQRQHGVSSL